MKLSLLFSESKYKTLIQQGHNPEVVQKAREISSKYIVWLTKMIGHMYDGDIFMGFDDLELIVKWAEKNKINLEKYGIEHSEDLLAKAIEWGKISKGLSYDPIFKFDNGWAIVSVPKEDIQLEGRLMRNCLKQGAYSEGIYSLRNKNNNPHASIRINPKTGNVEDIRGKNNEVPKKEYMNMIRKWLKSENLRAADREIGLNRFIDGATDF